MIKILDFFCGKEVFKRKDKKRECIQNRNVNRFYKSDIDYKYFIDRPSISKKNRFVKKDVWEQKQMSSSEKAVIICGGDLMCEPGMSEACYFDGDYDYRPCFKYLKNILEEVDFAIANLETIVSDSFPYAREKHRVEHHTGLRYHCNAPQSYLDALRYAGFDAFALANNHNADCGYYGIIDTLNNLDKRQFMHIGLFRDEEDSRILHVLVNGIRIAIISYTEHINRGIDKEVLTEDGCNIVLNYYSESKTKNDIKHAKKDGAEFILVYIHFLGKEYSHEVTASQQKIAQEIADSGADCIMGTHMHAIQRYDVLISSTGKRVPVMYSLGNLISSDATNNLIARRSVMYRLELVKEKGIVRIANESYIPLRVVEGMEGSSYVVFPTIDSYRNKSSDFFKKVTEQIAAEIGETLSLHI